MRTLPFVSIWTIFTTRGRLYTYFRKYETFESRHKDLICVGCHIINGISSVCIKLGVDEIGDRYGLFNGLLCS